VVFHAKWIWLPLQEFVLLIAIVIFNSDSRNYSKVYYVKGTVLELWLTINLGFVVDFMVPFFIKLWRYMEFIVSIMPRNLNPWQQIMVTIEMEAGWSLHLLWMPGPRDNCCSCWQSNSYFLVVQPTAYPLH
jgi:hypothetical protein